MQSGKKHSVFCVRATNAWKRMKGLIGKQSPFLPLHIPECCNIHTFFMDKPLALLWLDDEFTVIWIDYHVKPWRMRFCRNAKHVVEYEFGMISDNIKIGDTLILFNA